MAKTKVNTAPGIARYLGLMVIEDAAREFDMAVVTLRKLKERNLVTWTRIGRNIVFDPKVLARELLEYAEAKRRGESVVRGERVHTVLSARAAAQSQLINETLKKIQTLGDSKSLKIRARLEGALKAEAKSARHESSS